MPVTLRSLLAHSEFRLNPVTGLDLPGGSWGLWHCRSYSPVLDACFAPFWLDVRAWAVGAGSCAVRPVPGGHAEARASRSRPVLPPFCMLILWEMTWKGRCLAGGVYVRRRSPGARVVALGLARPQWRCSRQSGRWVAAVAGDGPGEGVKDHAEPDLELAAEVVAGPQDVLGCHLGKVRVLAGVVPSPAGRSGWASPSRRPLSGRP